MSTQIQEDFEPLHPEDPDVPQVKGGEVHKNFIIYLASQLLSWGVTFITLSVIPRTLGEASSGKLVVAQLAATLPLSILLFGIDQYLIKEVGRDRTQTVRLLGGALGLRLVLLIPAFFGTIALGFGLKAESYDWFLMTLMIPSAICNFFSPAYRAVFNGLEQATRVSGIDMVLSWSPLLAIPFLRFGPPAVVVAISLVAMISITIQSVWMRRLVRLKPIFDRALWKQLILGGIPFCVNNYLLSLYGAVSVFMVRHSLGDEGVGVVGQVGKLFGTFMFIPTALIAAILPSLARLAEANMEEFNRTKVRVLSLLVVVGLPVTAIVVVLAPPLCHLLYSKSKFLDMPLALQTIAIGLIPTYVVSTMYQFMVAQGRAHVWARFLLMTVVIYGIVSYISIPLCLRLFHNGPMGASVATVVAETISAAVSMSLLKIKVFDTEMIGRTIRGLVATAVMCAVMFYLERWLESLAPKGGMISFAVQLFIPAGVGTVVFAVLAWVLHIMLPEEQNKVASMLQRITGKMRPKTAG